MYADDSLDLSSDAVFLAARVAYRAKRPEAVALLSRLIAKAERADGRPSFTLAYLLEFRGRARTQQGDVEGLSDLRAARQLAIEIDDPFFPPAGVREAEARCLLELGRLADAADCFEQAADDYAAAGFEVESGLAAWRGAHVLQRLGRHDEADQLLELALNRAASDKELYELIAESRRDEEGQ